MARLAVRHHLAVGEHGFERQHVVLHGAVAHRIGARGARRRHAAERGVGAGIDRKKQAAVAQMLVERLARHAGLDDAIEVLGVHREHAVHVAEVEADAAAWRVDLAFQRGAGAEGHHRHAVRWRIAARSPAPLRWLAETPLRRAADWRSRWWYGRAARAPPATSPAGCRSARRALRSRQSAALRSCVLRCGASTSAMSRPYAFPRCYTQAFNRRIGGASPAGQASLLSAWRRLLPNLLHPARLIRHSRAHERPPCT